MKTLLSLITLLCTSGSISFLSTNLLIVYFTNVFSEKKTYRLTCFINFGIDINGNAAWYSTIGNGSVYRGISTTWSPVVRIDPNDSKTGRGYIGRSQWLTETKCSVGQKPQGRNELQLIFLYHHTGLSYLLVFIMCLFLVIISSSRIKELKLM